MSIQRAIYWLQRYADEIHESHYNPSTGCIDGADAGADIAELRAVAAALAAPALQPEPVGEAGTMPGTTGFTMACFRAVDVPAGTKLFTAPSVSHPKPADVLLTVIQRLNSAPYSLTKYECIEEVKAMRNTELAAAPKEQA